MTDNDRRIDIYYPRYEEVLTHMGEEILKARSEKKFNKKKEQCVEDVWLMGLSFGKRRDVSHYLYSYVAHVTH